MCVNKKKNSKIKKSLSYFINLIIVMEINNFYKIRGLYLNQKLNFIFLNSFNFLITRLYFL